MSSYVPELTACRDAFLRENGLASQPTPRGPTGREKLRITLLNDNGAFNGAGIAHVRLARALAWAGHEVSLVAILDGPRTGLIPLSTRPRACSIACLPQIRTW
jgi:hypothetical protein